MPRPFYRQISLLHPPPPLKHHLRDGPARSDIAVNLCSMFEMSVPVSQKEAFSNVCFCLHIKLHEAQNFPDGGRLTLSDRRVLPPFCSLAPDTTPCSTTCPFPGATLSPPQRCDPGYATEFKSFH